MSPELLECFSVDERVTIVEDRVEVPCTGILLHVLLGVARMIGFEEGAAEYAPYDPRERPEGQREAMLKELEDIESRYDNPRNMHVLL